MARRMETFAEEQKAMDDLQQKTEEHELKVKEQAAEVQDTAAEERQAEDQQADVENQLADREQPDVENQLADDPQNEKYPFIVRLYGVLCIIGAAVQILEIVIIVLAMLVAFSEGLDLSQIEASGHYSATTLVIGIVMIVSSVALTVMFLILGIRLLKGKRNKVALMATVMITLEIATLLCDLMLQGIGRELIAPFVNVVILIALQTYSDPALLAERRLQRKLLALERRTEKEEGVLGRDTTGKGYITLNFFNLFWVFVICCVIGLVLEVIWHMVVVDPGVYQDRAGLLYGPFSPIYGVGAVLMTVALNRFHNKNPLLIFLVSAVIGGAFEFFVSWFMETAFGIKAWDYTGTFMSIGGRTNFFFMCIWGVLGLAWIKFMLPIMLKWVNKIPWNLRYGVTVLCTVLMLVDAGLTLASYDCWYERVSGTMDYNDLSAIEVFCNENYDNEFMENRFQSMTMDPDSASRV